MVTHLVLVALSTVVTWGCSLIPDGLNPPGWITGSAQSVRGFFDAGATMGTWIPLDVAFLAAHALISAYIGGGLVKAVRILISHFTGGGGASS